GAAAGVFALVGGRVVGFVLGSAYSGHVGADLGHLVIYLSPWVVAAVAFWVTFPLLFVLETPRRLVPLAVVALAVDIGFAFGARAVRSQGTGARARRVDVPRRRCPDGVRLDAHARADDEGHREDGAARRRDHVRVLRPAGDRARRLPRGRRRPCPLRRDARRPAPARPCRGVALRPLAPRVSHDPRCPRIQASSGAGPASVSRSHGWRLPGFRIANPKRFAWLGKSRAKARAVGSSACNVRATRRRWRPLQTS